MCRGEQVQAALDAVNPQLPHYKQVRAFCLRAEPFSIENGMLTANGKLKRDSDCGAHEERDRGHVSGEAGGIAVWAHGGRAGLGVQQFKGQALSWQVKGGVIELALHRDPCNELGSLSLAELEQFASALDDLEKDAHALIVHSELKSGFCAGADLRELYERSQTMEKVAGRPGRARFSGANSPVY